MPAMQKVSAAKHHAFFQDFMDVSENQQSCSGGVISTPRDEPLVRTSSKDSRTVKRSAGKGQMICKHSCEHHAEVVYPGLWRNLPEELVELTFAKLPLPLIIKLRECSKAWYTMSKTSSNFLQACSESHPNLFGFLGWNVHQDSMWTALHDIQSKEWLFVELAGLPGSDTYGRWETENFTGEYTGEYRNSICACDGGLICFVPHEHLTSCSILVCNPLTSIWKTPPLTPLEDFENKETKMVQPVVDNDTKIYRVILVSRESSKKISAHFYSSEPGTWSIMESCLVYGADDELSAGPGVPYVFDCTSKTLFDLTHCASLASIDALDYAVAKDDLFVLHESNERGLRSGYPNLVSEFVWESSLSDLRRLDVSKSPIQVFPAPYKGMLFASPSFVLLFADNCEKWDEDHYQLMGLYDAAANRWDIPPPVPFGLNIHSEELDRSFTVELRWDINP